MKLTYFGHSCFLLETSKAHILFDPFITPNSLVTERKTYLSSTGEKDLLSPENITCDHVFISHGHEDHTADALTILKRTGAKAVGNWEVVTWLQNKGITNIHPMNLGGAWTFEFGRVKMIPAIHSSSMPDGSYGGNPGGYVIQADNKTIYYAGDTSLTYDMKLIAEEFTLDWALLPIGDNFTMGVEDALKAASFINCTNIIGMHYDTFGYIKVDHEKTKEHFAENGRKITLMAIGETKKL